MIETEAAIAAQPSFFKTWRNIYFMAAASQVFFMIMVYLLGFAI